MSQGQHFHRSECETTSWWVSVLERGVLLRGYSLEYVRKALFLIFVLFFSGMKLS